MLNIIEFKNSIWLRPYISLLIFLSMIIFWSIRILYWNSIEEEPFSDMANFDQVSHSVLCCWVFDWSEFWKTYSTPTLFVFRAVDLYLFGEGLDHWRYFQTFFLFVFLVWSAYEIYLFTKNYWISLVLLLITALSKPSIFWSYKLSREYLHEMLIFAVLATFMFAIRKNTYVSYFLLGIILITNILNRPNSLIITPFLFLLIFIIQFRKLNTSKKFSSRLQMTSRRLVLPFALITFGLLSLWTPWVVRSVLIYKEPVLLSLQTPYTFLWELGDITVKLDNGEVITTNVNSLQSNAYKDFPNDLAASKYATKIMNAWIQEHALELPQIILRRIQASINNKVEYLTKVSRTDLFHNKADKLLLFDKSKPIVLLGIVGLILFPIRFGTRLWIFPLCALVPWLSGAAMVGYPRMLDPSLSLIIFGSFISAFIIYEKLISLFLKRE